MALLISCSGQWSLLRLKLENVEFTAFTLNQQTGAWEASNKEVFNELRLRMQNGGSNLFSGRDSVSSTGVSSPL